MKKFIIAYLLFFPVLVFAQEVPKEYRKMNTIIVQPNFQSDDWLKEIGNLFLDEGFEIENLDREFGMIVSKPKNVVGMDWQIRVRIKNELAEITHYGRMNLYSNMNTGAPMTQMDFSAGMKNSALRMASDGIYLFAQKVGQIVEWKAK